MGVAHETALTARTIFVFQVENTNIQGDEIESVMLQSWLRPICRVLLSQYTGVGANSTIDPEA